MTDWAVSGIHILYYNTIHTVYLTVLNNCSAVIQERYHTLQRDKDYFMARLLTLQSARGRFFLKRSVHAWMLFYYSNVS